MADTQAMGGIYGKLAETWPARLLRGAYGAVTLPGDVYQGKVTANDPSYYERATDLAGLVMGGTYGSAPRGAIGSGPTLPIAAPSRIQMPRFTDFVSSLADGPVYARWSRGKEFDMRPGAVSRDYQSGKHHDGLSAIELSKNDAPDQLLRLIADYGFLRMKDEKIRPHLYRAERIGVDTDNAPTIRPTEYLGSLTDEAVNFISDPSNLKRMSLMDSIEKNKSALAHYSTNPPPANLIPIWTEDSLRKLESDLAALGGKVQLPDPFFK